MEKITVCRLTPELCGDWVQYFDEIAFKDHQDWAFCYCLEGHLEPKTQESWINAQERRARAIELIQSGVMQGYLAYAGDRVVGWCNVNDRENYLYLTTMFREIGYQPEGRAKAIYCFLIAPEFRGKGVAQSLLDRVCEDAAQDGYDCIEVYPFVDKQFEFQYHGTYGMYVRNGFTEIADLQYVKVMQKKLERVDKYGNIPNAETQKAIEDAQNGIGLSRGFSSVRELMEDLNSDD